MVTMKTTVNLDDDLYKKLVKETVEKYGNTKNLSKLINEKLERAEGIAVRENSDEVKRRLKILRENAGGWKGRERGKEYVKEMRHGWSKRLKTAGL
ncbi:MAG: hypothetical protein KGI02_06090 [Thaumarchaeota archaeon]|nr:hypothetical protein [Nitrososphaerota archaeon]